MSVTYVAFLRAVNLGAVRRLPMAEVRAVLADAGYDDLATHLATGNVRLRDGAGREPGEVRDDVAARLGAHAGFDVPVVLLGVDELAATRAEAHGLDDGPAGRAARRLVALLPARPAPEAAAELERWTAEHPREGAHLGARHLHWWTDGSTAEAAIFKPATLRRLGIGGATSRTLPVVDTLVERWC